MKFTWFNLMPWPYLPDDFRETNRSVWVDIDQKLFDPARSHEVYNTYMDLLEYADTLGFDGVGVNEHHQNGYGIMPSPNIIAAGLARRTKDAAIVVLGNSIALYNPPVRVAEEFAMLDCISGGRLVAGFPVGTSMDTNYCYGQIPSLTREKYQEAHDLIIKAWTTREPFAFNGRYNKLRHVNIWPRPIQQPHPPVHIPGGGSVETYDFCIDNTYSYSYLSFSGYLRAQALMSGYWKRVEERGVDKSPYRAGFAQTILVADTDEEAERLYSEHVSYFYNRCLHVYPGFADAPGYRTIKTIQTGALSQYAPPRGGYAQLTWKELTEQGHVIAGSPETVRQRMEDLIKGLNVGNIFCLMHVGNMPADKCMYSTKLFAEKVMPKLRNMFPDWESDNRFWTTPLAKRVTSGRLPKEAPTSADLAKTYALEAGE
ncbi:MAG TPA: LLM class flavin-dependent oxidoreductase [Phenylobacterium sp.]|jgi:alkanesulfonate monooxygenase SsuD/methylene tetrahydromethanopterin reductase-like flavin-dependent oxidoreductase (luciferase family)|uniref:LLM class flavin-dependent oxidoreductase n=1 Tax=Phenylobacterium sp. TaxID=1871053 RepID=UPI002D51C56F|nr:LLM class flavin-dependent oxidoreductase [Phenylobacterium sp.]HZZ68471.1 LLM class flavin-dependent oxidoreductase [Phenylobacterium sp.]